jgi:peptidyl-prolyl cis-trans isomerase B (cyclophilin B)
MRNLVLVFAVAAIIIASGRGWLRAADLVQVEMRTNVGVIVLELDRERAPRTVENFLKYVERRFYDGTVFHRIIVNFMIQGGGFDRRDLKTPKAGLPAIPNESANGLPNKKYTIAMARGDHPDSATSQFFINTANHNSHLDRRDNTFQGAGHCVFGRVTRGFEVVDAIELAPVRPVENNVASEPIDAVVIEQVSVLGALR